MNCWKLPILTSYKSWASKAILISSSRVKSKWSSGHCQCSRIWCTSMGSICKIRHRRLNQEQSKIKDRSLKPDKVWKRAIESKSLKGTEVWKPGQRIMWEKVVHKRCWALVLLTCRERVRQATIGCIGEGAADMVLLRIMSSKEASLCRWIRLAGQAQEILIPEAWIDRQSWAKSSLMIDRIYYRWRIWRVRPLQWLKSGLKRSL